MDILLLGSLFLIIILLTGAFYFLLKRKIVITLRRLQCYGHCPVYDLTILGSGKVVFKGEKFVDAVGTKIKTIDKEKIRELVSEFEKANFFSLKDSYDERMATDLSGAIVSIKVKGKTKTVHHYHGDTNAPKELSVLEDKIDEIVGTKEWIGGGGKWVK